MNQFMPTPFLVRDLPLAEPQPALEELHSMEELPSEPEDEVPPVLYKRPDLSPRSSLDESSFLPPQITETVNSIVSKIRSRSNSLAEMTGKELNHMFDSSAVIVEQAIGQLGLGKPGSSILEEHERSRRSGQTLDPVVSARKRHVERELLERVKPT
eukprot:TRINITY_DN20110_c0_g1_i2.p1 TRINITY_DN20110_c0_g1~~TRINITY_DN20110_c0_g1_i2.p1  ORF type:complete len:156 (+),score=29.58 TRINITY_DN20110_c0_g1_i2:74-541(+)